MLETHNNSTDSSQPTLPPTFHSIVIQPCLVGATHDGPQLRTCHQLCHPLKY